MKGYIVILTLILAFSVISKEKYNNYIKGVETYENR